MQLIDKWANLPILQYLNVRACNTQYQGAASLQYKAQHFVAPNQGVGKNSQPSHITPALRNELCTLSKPRCSKIFAPIRFDYILLRAKPNTAAAAPNQVKIGEAPLWGWSPRRDNAWRTDSL